MMRTLPLPDFTLFIKDKDPKKYTVYGELEKDFAEERVHPLDLKESVIVVLNQVEPGYL